MDRNLLTRDLNENLVGPNVNLLDSFCSSESDTSLKVGQRDRLTLTRVSTSEITAKDLKSPNPLIKTRYFVGFMDLTSIAFSTLFTKRYLRLSLIDTDRVYPWTIRPITDLIVT